MGNKGFSLIFIIFLIVIITLLGSMIVRTIINTNSSVYINADKAKAFYLAEAAIEYGKTKTNNNPSWYTDAPHSGDPVKWLKSFAKGESILSGAKTIKEYNGHAIYGLGQYNKSYVIIKFEDGIFEED